MDILLLNPPSPDTSWFRPEHLGIAYLAAVLRQEGHNVSLLDANLEDWNILQTYQVVREFGKIDILGITAMESKTFQSGIEVTQMLKRDGLNTHVTMGGYFPTFWSDEILREFPEVDSVVVGEGEGTTCDLVSALKQNRELVEIPGLVYRTEDNKIVHNQPRPLIRELDQLPFPSRDYLLAAYQRQYVATMYSSRGCYHKCSFCQISRFYRLSPGPPYRSRSAGNIAEEIEILVNRYGIKYILFVDDEFIGGSSYRKRVLEALVDEIRRRQLDFGFAIQYRADHGDQVSLLKELKTIGLTTVFIGIESGIDSMLERFDKGISKSSIQRALRVVRELDLGLVVGYILFDPITTFEELQQNVEYLLSPEAPTVLDLHGMFVLKGTLQETNLRKRGLVTKRNFKLICSVPDKKVALFSDLLDVYYRMYRCAVLDVHKLHFLLGNFPRTERPDAMQEMKLVEQKVRCFHQQFLYRAVEDLSQGKSEGGTWLDDFKMAYQLLHIETQRLVSEWASSLSLAADRILAN